MRRAVLAAALVAAVGLLPATLARAEPDVTDDDVAAAQQAVRSTAAQVAAIEVELAEQSAALEAAWVTVATAAEAYTQALVASDAATAEASTAAERAAQAEQDVEEARAELGRIALEAHRSGGSLDSLAVLLDAEGYDDLVARSTAIEQMGERADRAVQRFQVAELVSRTLAQRATDAADAAQQATTVAQDALTQAQQLQEETEAQVARVAAQREGLLAQLAELKQTSVEVERARQVQLDAERTTRADAAARAGHEQGAPAAPAAGGTTPISASPSNGTPPSSAEPTPPPATQPTPPPSAPPPSDPHGLGTGSQRGSAAQGEAAVAWALQQVGKPYVYGGSGPDSFDCSGLTMRAWEAAGVAINRSSRDQYRQVYKITYDSMRPGDLIFYGTSGSDSGSVYHVAMFIGNGQIVEASQPGVPLRVVPVRWANTMPYAGRP